MTTTYYKQQLEDGKKYEEFIARYFLSKYNKILGIYKTEEEQLLGECKAGIEIKHDKEFCNTENLWIECCEKRDVDNYDWIESGIYRQDNSKWYLIGDYNCFWIFDIEVLRRLRSNYRVIENKRQTSKGYLLETYVADEYCYKKEVIHEVQIK